MKKNKLLRGVTTITGSNMKTTEETEETFWSAVIEATRTNSTEPIKKAMQAYADQQVNAKWISVEDKSPKEYERCLVFNTANREGWEMEIQGFVPNRFSHGVTHWMPLPEPPQT